jgi:NRPS condensation-like uncharacterized protein
MTNVPDRLPTVAADRLALVYVKSGVGEMIINLDLEFDRRLNSERLRLAFFLSFEAHPVLGRRLEPDPILPYWELVPLPENLFRVVATEEEFDRFRVETIDPTVGPQLTAALWPAPAGDRLLLKVAHTAADTGGLKEIAETIAQCYRRLESDPAYRPEPSTGSRSFNQIMDHVPARAYPILAWNFLSQTFHTLYPAQTHIWQWRGEGPREPRLYVVRRLEPERVRSLAEYGKARHATLNDLTITAFYRSLALAGGWDGKKQLRLQTTIDLRRWYLPEERGAEVCNLSAYLYPRLGRELGKDFDETLAQVAAGTRAQKRSWPGLTDICLGPLIRRASYRQLELYGLKAYRAAAEKATFPNGITNMGIVRPERVDFGVRPVRAHCLAPMGYPPLLIGGLSGYQGSLTFSFGTSAWAAPQLERFVEGMLAELPED